MKTYCFALLLFACAGHLPAQSDSDKSSGRKPDVGWTKNPDPDGNVRLPPGTLKEIVEFIEHDLMATWTGHVGNMPNILMSQEVGNLEIPGGLTLHRVSPLQAVVLAAAAVNCSLEPILDPTPAADGTRSSPILGYRITQTKTPTTESANITLPTASAASASGPPTKDSEPVIRIYAVGAVLHAGSEDEIKRDEAMFQVVLHDALDKSDPDSPPPDLTLHTQSKTLIVKATPAQQEIVEQVIKALKENKELTTRPAATVKP
jgi:hypothetical protein